MSGWILSDETVTKLNTLPYDFENGIAVVEKILSESGINNVSSYRYYPKPSDVGKTIIFTFSEGTSRGTKIISGGPGMPISEDPIYPSPDGTKYMSFSHIIGQHNYYIQYNFDRQSTLQVTIDGVSVVEKDRLHLLGGTERQIIDDELKTVRVPYHYYTDGNDIWKSVSDLSGIGWNIFGNLDHKRTPAFFFKGDSSGSSIFNAVELYQANTDDGLPKIYRRLDMHDYDPGFVPNPGEYYVWQLQYTALSYLIGFDLSVVIYNDYIYLLGNQDASGYVMSSIIKVSRDLDNTKEQAVYANQTPYGTIGPYSIVYDGAIHNFGGDRWGNSHYKWDGSNYTYVSTLPHGGITGVTVYQDELYALFSEDEGQLYKFNGSTWDEVTTAYFTSSTKSVLIMADSNINVLGCMATHRERARWNPSDGVWYPRGKNILGIIKNGWVNVITGSRDTYAMVGSREIYTGKEYIRTPKKIKNGWKITENGPIQILKEVNHFPSEWDNSIIPALPYIASQSYEMTKPQCQSISWSYYDNNEWKDEIHIIADDGKHYVCRQTNSVWTWTVFATGQPSGFSICRQLFIAEDHLWMVWKKSSGSSVYLSRFNYYIPGSAPSQTNVYSWELMSTMTESANSSTGVHIHYNAFWAISTLTYNSPDVIYRMWSDYESSNVIRMHIDEFDSSSKDWTECIVYTVDDWGTVPNPDKSIINMPLGWIPNDLNAIRMKIPIIGWKNVSYFIDRFQRLIQINHNTDKMTILGDISTVNSQYHDQPLNLFIANGIIHCMTSVNAAGDVYPSYYFVGDHEEKIVSDKFYNSMSYQGQWKTNYLVFDHIIPGPSYKSEGAAFIRIPQINGYNIDYMEGITDSVYVKDLLPE